MLTGCIRRGAAIAVAALVFTAACAGPPRRTPAVTQPAAVPTSPGVVLDPTVVWASWALLDRGSGTVTRGGREGTSTTESMIKIAVVGQYLADTEASGRRPSDQELDMMSRAVRDSDNEATEALYRRGGGDRLIRSVITTCGLTGTSTTPGWWSQTQMPPADAARMGDCLATGRVGGQRWAAWLVNEMRQVRGVGRFGIIDAYPTDAGRPLAIKNGWTVRDYDELWHVNCLAVTDQWVLAVMVRYPAARGIALGAATCRDVASVVVPAAASPPPQ